MLQHTQSQWIGTPAHTASFANAPDMPASAFMDLAYVDDAALALHAPTIGELVSLIQHAAMAMHQAIPRSEG